MKVMGKHGLPIVYHEYVHYPSKTMIGAELETFPDKEEKVIMKTTSIPLALSTELLALESEILIGANLILNAFKKFPELL